MEHSEYMQQKWESHECGCTFRRGCTVHSTEAKDAEIARLQSALAAKTELCGRAVAACRAGLLRIGELESGVRAMPRRCEYQNCNCTACQMYELLDEAGR